MSIWDPKNAHGCRVMTPFSRRNAGRTKCQRITHKFPQLLQQKQHVNAFASGRRFFKIWKMQMCLTYIVFWSLSYLIYVTTCYFVGEMKDSNVSYLYFIHVSCVFSVMRKYILFLNFHLHTLLAPPLISSLN